MKDLGSELSMHESIRREKQKLYKEEFTKRALLKEEAVRKALVVLKLGFGIGFHRALYLMNHEHRIWCKSDYKYKHDRFRAPEEIYIVKYRDKNGEHTLYRENIDDPSSNKRTI